jgi:hypothetical protein
MARLVSGSANDALGRVDAIWIDAGIFAQIDVAVGPIRLAPDLHVAAGAIVATGVPSREDVIGHRRVAATLVVGIGLDAEVPLAGPLSLALGGSVDLVLSGVQARAEARSALALGGLAPSVRAVLRLSL